MALLPCRPPAPARRLSPCLPTAAVSQRQLADCLRMRERTAPRAPRPVHFAKVDEATYRNRLRRLYREAFRLTRHEIPAGLDLVLIPRAAEEPSLAELKRSLPRLVRQLAQRLQLQGTKA